MSDGNKAAAGLRERFTGGTEDKLGRALADLFDNPLISGTIGRAFDARERAAQAQEAALGALNIPSAADIERLTRRLRSVSQRLEGIEDGVHRLNRALSDGGIDTRLSAVEDQLKTLTNRISDSASKAVGGTGSVKTAGSVKAASSSKAAGRSNTAGPSKAANSAEATSSREGTGPRARPARATRAAKTKKPS
jgi:hypothetical protein